MNRDIRIGVLAEGEAELGPSIPYIKPQDGGRPIPRSSEGALHSLIRRELHTHGWTNVQFVQRHPTSKERSLKMRRRGFGILERRYLARTIAAWQQNEVDIIVLVVDSDDVLDERQRDLSKAIEVIKQSHLDSNGDPIDDQNVGSLAVKSFDTWLLADTSAIATVLQIEVAQELPDNLEQLPGNSRLDTCSKNILDALIHESSFDPKDEREGDVTLKVRWALAEIVDPSKITKRCPTGYAQFQNDLVQTCVNFARKQANLPNSGEDDDFSG